MEKCTYEGVIHMEESRHKLYIYGGDIYTEGAYHERKEYPEGYIEGTYAQRGHEYKGYVLLEGKGFNSMIVDVVVIIAIVDVMMMIMFSLNCVKLENPKSH